MSAEEDTANVTSGEDTWPEDGVAQETIQSPAAATAEPEPGRARVSCGRFPRVAAFVVLPVVIVVLAAVTGWAFFTQRTLDASRDGGAEAVQQASDAAIAMLTYQPDTAERQLVEASARLTGDFKDEYLALVHSRVVPGAQSKQIAAVATVPGAALLSVTSAHAEVLVYVNQSMFVGQDAPSNSTSSVRVSLEKKHGAWFVSQFEPI